jgi:tRNA (mo5U34)-methyltransferase
MKQDQEALPVSTGNSDIKQGRKILPASAAALKDFHVLLDWQAAAPLPDGRILGRANWLKRAFVNAIPDKRIVLLNKLLPLRDRSVLEIGCFEGIHTMGLLQHTDNVTAVDLRPVNVLKTLARLSLSGYSAPVFVANCEELDESFGRFDVVFHFGVLYHLMRPVQHLKMLSRLADTIYLDTHFAPEKKANLSVEVDGETYAYAQVNEKGWLDPFSGADPTSIHLSYESLRRAVVAAGFTNTCLLNYRAERNGPRILMFASRTVDVSGFPAVADPRV